MAVITDTHANEDFCYLSTTGRVSGRVHTVEIWFATADDRATIFILSGGGDRADWVRNIRRNANVSVRIGGKTWSGQGRIVTDDAERAAVAQRVYEKYRSQNPGLTPWRDRSLPVAIALEANP